jgi:glucokinase
MSLPISSELLVAIDLGGSNVRVALADPSGRLVAQRDEATARGDATALVAQLGRLSRQVAGEAGVEWAQVAAVGIGVPGVVGRDGGLSLAPNLPPLAGQHVLAELRARLEVPVIVENDVNLATLAEHRHGRGVGVSDFAFIAVGTGVGMGVVASGQLQRGATGAAGEIAFLPVGGDPFDPANHVAGSVEVLAGGAAIARRYSATAGTEGLSALDVYARAADGDARARAVLDDQSRVVALVVLSTLSILDPALVVLGGGIGMRDGFADQVRSRVGELTSRGVRIETSDLGERAGLVGAAELASMAAARARPQTTDREAEAIVRD